MAVTQQGTTTTSSFPRQLGDGNVNGTVMGRKTNSSGLPDQIAFFGGDPVVQPGGQGVGTGSSGLTTIYTSTQSPSAVAANTTAEKAMTVTGVAATDFVIVTKPTSQAGLGVASARVSAANTVQLTLINDTSGSITPTASEGYNVVGISAGQCQSLALTPASVPSNTTVEQQFPLAGLTPGQFVAVNKPTLQAGLAVVNARVASPGVLGITYANVTGSAIVPTAETYLVFAAAGLSIAPIMSNIVSALNPASVAANTTAEQTFTVPGLAAGTVVAVDKPSLTPGLGIVGARVSAANTLAINFMNDTAVAIDPPLENYSISYFPQPIPAAGSTVVASSSNGASDHASLVSLNLVAGP